MKIKTYGWILGSSLMLLSSLAQASIATSKHNLSSSGDNAASQTDQICVFCHTPHGSDISAPAPLWNKALPDAATFTTYDDLGTATLDGQINLNEGGISLACLSCHDGVSSMDLVLNAPTETSGVYRYDANGTLINGGQVMAAGTPVPVLGQDLRDDHPVGVQYAGGGLTWASIQAGNNVTDSANDKGFTDPIWNNNRLWVAEVGGDGLPLYNGATLGPLVECASCHDPHKTDHGSFLRMSNAGSALCLACHVK